MDIKEENFATYEEYEQALLAQKEQVETARQAPEVPVNIPVVSKKLFGLKNPFKK